VKPLINQGEEEWAELMRANMNSKNGDWYAKGVQLVQVSNIDSVDRRLY